MGPRRGQRSAQGHTCDERNQSTAILVGVELELSAQVLQGVSLPHRCAPSGEGGGGGAGPHAGAFVTRPLADWSEEVELELLEEGRLCPR